MSKGLVLASKIGLPDQLVTTYLYLCRTLMSLQNTTTQSLGSHEPSSIEISDKLLKSEKVNTAFVRFNFEEVIL